MSNSKKLGKSNSHLLPISDNKIFIGEILSLPVIGRLLSKRTQYMIDVKRIKEAVKHTELKNMNSAHKTTHLTLLDRNTEVEIIEKEDCISVNVEFKGNTLKTGFLGLTDSKGVGYQRFINQFKLRKNLLIVLICAETGEELHISGFFNIKLTTLEK